MFKQVYIGCNYILVLFLGMTLHSESSYLNYPHWWAFIQFLYSQQHVCKYLKLPVQTKAALVKL